MLKVFFYTSGVMPCATKKEKNYVIRYLSTFSLNSVFVYCGHLILHPESSACPKCLHCTKNEPVILAEELWFVIFKIVGTGITLSANVFSTVRCANKL